MNSSKDTAIRHVTELVLEFSLLLGESRRLDGLKLIPAGRPEVAEFQLDGRNYRFRLYYVLTPSLHALPTLTPHGEEIPLLVVPNLTQAVLTACRQAQVSAADLNGRLFLRAPGLLVELPALNGRRYRFDLEPRNVFVGKSARIVRALLADPERLWKQSDLVTRTGATSGLVSRIVTHLVRQGMVARSRSGKRLQVFHLTSRDALLDAWAQADQFARRVTTHRFHCLDQDPVQLARKLSQALTQQGAPFAFTQWIAAWIRHPYTEPPLASLYVPQLPSPDALNSLGLRAVAEGGRVWFHLPVDEGVFRETRLVENLPLVSDAQIYLDLQNTGLRGPEQARALRESSVFCRP
jgi:DNA-binding MarR family transcriptional regulator